MTTASPPRCRHQDPDGDRCARERGHSGGHWCDDPMGRMRMRRPCLDCGHPTRAALGVCPSCRCRPRPWVEEPNEARWVDPETGLRCHVLRDPLGGHLCGYVALPEGYTEPDVDTFSVHEGITSAFLDRDGTNWIGFDCGHVEDLRPFERASLGLPPRRPDPAQTYRTFSFVQAECAHLADQIATRRAQRTAPQTEPPSHP